jgi:cardiolipin synthase
MRRIVAIPVYRMSCQVGVDRGRAWSVVEELLLWSIKQQPQTIDQLAEGGALQRSIVVASLTRMMRFRLVEVTVTSGQAIFHTSALGSGLAGEELPYFPKRSTRRVRFVVDWATGSLLREQDVRLATRQALDEERNRGVDVRIVDVYGGKPPISPDSNLARLADIIARGRDERLASVESRTATVHDDHYLRIEVTDGAVTGLPQEVSSILKKVVDRLAHAPNPGDVRVQYLGRKDRFPVRPRRIRCNLDTQDVLVGGAEHKQFLVWLFRQAERRIIVHSTFISRDKFTALIEEFRIACRRGVVFDILWGAASDDETVGRNATSAAQIMEIVRGDADLIGRVRVHLRSTGSHAKILLSDGPNRTWTAVIGSCNWLLSPFRTVELSAVLRERLAVAEVAGTLSSLVAQRGAPFDDLVSELGLISKTLTGGKPPPNANGEASIIVGMQHDGLARHASGSAKHRLAIGSHRIGATARPGALLPSALSTQA